VRPREAIIADILEIAREPTGSTRIIYLANLSNKQFSLYSRFLQDKRLIKKREDRTWLTTGRGEEYLLTYSALKRILDQAEQTRSHDGEERGE
jgi:predicted transcriptional regulator